MVRPLYPFAVGDPVVVYHGRWIGESGSVTRVTPCYVWITFETGVPARVKKEDVILIAEASEASESESDGMMPMMISDDETDGTE